MRHHYVPEFLQNPWVKSSSDGKLEVFNLKVEGIPSRRHTPKHTGYEHNLYALSEDQIAGMQKQALEEHYLSVIDNNAAKIRAKLEANGLQGLTKNEQMDWTRFLMSLRVRQPSVVERLKMEAADNLAGVLRENPEEYEELALLGAPPSLKEWVEQYFPGLIKNFGLSIFHEIADNEEVGEKILQMKWSLWTFTDTTHELLLSDHPCIFLNGLNDPNCVIALPIGPKQAFIATNSVDASNRLRKLSGKDLVVALNESSVNQANTRIYATDETPRRFIQNRIKARDRMRGVG